MAIVIKKEAILSVVKNIDTITAMEKGFVAYSQGKTVVPPVAELLFNDPKGETHIKYGYIKDDDYYVIKIASGFYENTDLGISSSQGLLLLFSKQTGEIKAILLDEGHLTNIRTAAAGALAAKYFAPKNIKAIGIIGTGIQARLQLQYLQKYTSCKDVWVWGRNNTKTVHYQQELISEFKINIAQTPKEVAAHCNLIITTTPSETALLSVSDILPGTHITAVGSDTQNKQELDSNILTKADLVIADSIPQSKSRGEIYNAVKEGKLNPDKVIELGRAIQDKSLQRTHENQITVVDLTGVAVQDIMIAKEVYKSFLNKKNQ